MCTCVYTFIVGLMYKCLQTVKAVSMLMRKYEDCVSMDRGGLCQFLEVVWKQYFSSMVASCLGFSYPTLLIYLIFKSLFKYKTLVTM